MRRLSTALAAACLLAALPSVSKAQTRRVAHTATLLTSGDLLIAGGVNDAGTTLNSSDLFAASRGEFFVATPDPTMTVARASHTATLMSNGCVLVAGGNTAATDVAAPVGTVTAEIYNPTTGNWTATGSMGLARYNHTATLLNDGRVLICGGQEDDGDAVPGVPLNSGSCELYTPTSCTAGAFTADTPMQQARYNHTATLLKDGKVWFAGGANPAVGATNGVLPTTERYVPNPAGAGAGTFQSASPLIVARAYHTATLMGDGKALVVGGYNKRDVLANKGITESAEIYDPVSNSVTPAAAMSTRRQSHSSLVRAGGDVKVFGGLGNITTTYVLGADLYPANAFITGSSVTAVKTATPGQATITGGSGLLNLDYILSKPVIGQISNGEMWISSPSVMATWGAVRFTPASETVPTTGLRIDLSGVQVGCRRDVTPADFVGNCGNISKVAPNVARLSQMQGTVVFYRRTAVTLSGDPIVSGPSSLTIDALINSSNANANVTAGNFRATVRIPMDNAFLTYMINSATFTLTSANLVQPSSFSVTLTGGVGVVNNIAITADAVGNAEMVATINFTSLAGGIAFEGDATQSFGPGAISIPMAGAQMTAGGLSNMDYTTSGADLTANTFLVDVATVVVRKMIFADGETYDPKANSWTLFPPAGYFDIAEQRYGHSATLLPNNDIFMFGGRACAGPTVCAAQTANADTDLQLVSHEKNFAAATSLSAQPRAFHTSTLLPGGDILVAGGTNGPSILRHAELFTPGTDVFSPVNGNMRYVRDLHTATLLPNGRVLVAGGFTTNAASTGSTNTAELYYPDTKRFIETAPMISSRSNHTAIMLPDGRVFVAGGFGPGDVITGTAEIFITTESRWIPAATMPAGCQRAIHATVQLKDGRIMLIGGVNASGPMDTTAFYNPATDSWACSLAGEMPTALRSHSATLLFDGRVLVAGGNDGFGEANKSYIVSPGAGTAGVWTATDVSPFLEPRFNHTATLLPNGTVMISGGSQSGGAVPVSIETFHVNASSWVTGGIGLAGARFAVGARAYHTMTLALNNKIYAIGGSDGVVGGVGVALHNTAEGGYFTSTPDLVSKDAPPSFRQSTISDSYPTPFLPAANLAVNGTRFRGGTEASGGGAASANSAFSFPHMILQQVDGSGGAASQSNGGFAVDLTTEIFQNAANLATLDTSLTVPLPAATARLPVGWYTLRMGANDVYSDAKMLQVGPVKPAAAPAAITGIAAGISSMTWSWNSIPGVDGYNVYNATTGVFISSIPATLLTRATFYQTGLAASATSSIFVAAYSLSGDGPLTASPTSYTLSTTPVNVTIASVTFSDLLLYWGFNGNDETGAIYEVTQSSDNFLSGIGISTPIPRLFNLTTNFTIIPNLLSNTTYFFRVQAFNLAGVASPYSAIVSTRTRAPVTQPIVTGRTTTSIDWGWADPGGVTNYRVYNATNNVLLAAPTLNSFSEVGLGTNTEHSIRVTAVTNAGEGPLSPSASAYTNAASPGPFVPVISGLTTGSLLINWTNNDNPLQTDYETTLTEFASNGSVVSVSTAEALDLTFSQGYGGLVPSTLYRYEIVAFNGQELPSDTPAAVFGSTYTLPTAPAALIVTGTTPNDILVSWGTNNNSSTATYQVTYSSDNFTLNIATAVFFSQKFGGNTAIIAGLVTGATYSVRVIASNPFGQLSQFSNVVTTRTFNGGGPVGSVQGPILAAADSSFSGSIGTGRKILLRAPASAFSSDVTVNIAPATGTLCSVGTKDLAFTITAAPALQPTRNLFFTFDYTTADLGAIPVSRALLLRYDPGSGTCVPLETTVDAASGQMTARLDHFSLFQVGTVPLATTADSARIFPNPFYTSRGNQVKIDNIPPSARVRIFTLRGEQVFDDKANSVGLRTWDGTNGSGRSVASGVYLVMVESGSSKKILKLAVIR